MSEHADGTAGLVAPPGVTAASARRQNLSRLLTLVHREGAQTRAALTRRTGLNRSTVGGLVAELAARGLVQESEPAEPVGVGRPSPLVCADPSVAVLTVNPDTDALTLGLVGLGGVVHKRLRYPTSAGLRADEVVNLVAVLVAGMRSELDREYAVLGVGVAVPGLVDHSSGTVTLAPHLGWRDEPLGTRISEATGYPCLVANDARAAMLAELWFGAGAGRQDFVYLNGSASGIGGGVVSGGRAVTGRHGYAGELGHTLVNPGGLRCHCGRTGCLETEVTRAGLLAALSLDEASAEELSSRLGRAVAEGRPEVLGEIERQSRWLAQALSDTVNVLDPEAVVLGGFLADVAESTEPTLGHLVRSTGFAALAADVAIVPAELGTEVLTIGAAELVFADLLADPQAAAALTS